MFVNQKAIKSTAISEVKDMSSEVCIESHVGKGEGTISM